LPPKKKFYPTLLSGRKNWNFIQLSLYLLYKTRQKESYKKQLTNKKLYHILMTLSR